MQPLGITMISRWFDAMARNISSIEHKQSLLDTYGQTSGQVKKLLVRLLIVPATITGCNILLG